MVTSEPRTETIRPDPVPEQMRRYRAPFSVDTSRAIDRVIDADGHWFPCAPENVDLTAAALNLFYAHKQIPW